MSPKLSPLDQPFYRTAAGLEISGRLATVGTSILGATGAGKTSSVARELIVSALKTGTGAIIFAAKGSDADDVRAWLKAAGRPPEDLIDFGPGTGHRFDVASYVWNRPGGQQLEELIEIIRTLVQVANPDAGSGKERFFELATNDLVRTALILLWLAKRPISIGAINDLIDSFPTEPGQYATKEFQAESQLLGVLETIRERHAAKDLTPAQWADFAIAQHSALVKWPGLHPETRTSVHATWAGFASPFLFSPVREAFSSGTSTFIPEQAETGKVILVNWPVLQLGHTGRMGTSAMKLVCHLAWTKRVITNDSPIVLYVSDEVALTLLPEDKDAKFAAVCRGSRIASLFVTQSVHNLAAALGEHNPGSKTRTWLGSTAVKVITQSHCPETNAYFSEGLIGKQYQMLQGISGVGGVPTVSGHEQLVHTLLPTFFTTLQKPDGQNPYAGAVVYAGGELFDNGLNYLVTHFTR